MYQNLVHKNVSFTAVQSLCCCKTILIALCWFTPQYRSIFIKEVILIENETPTRAQHMFCGQITPRRRRHFTIHEYIHKLSARLYYSTAPNPIQQYDSQCCFYICIHSCTHWMLVRCTHNWMFGSGGETLYWITHVAYTLNPLESHKHSTGALKTMPQHPTPCFPYSPKCTIQ